MSRIDPGMQDVIKTALRTFVQAIRVEDDKPPKIDRVN
jgi:hypothetical protein